VNICPNYYQAAFLASTNFYLISV